jgi:alpha/beta superfamily hydrolase
MHITGPSGGLEAIVQLPGSVTGNRVAVICHPHPQHQGTMMNKVVHTLARSMNDLGMPAVRFNFRGVGASAGDYADGEGEIEDVVAVADYARLRWPEAELYLAGFSFGAVVAARAAARVQPAQLISIAPAVNILGKRLAEKPGMRWLIIQGAEDEIVPAVDVVEWVDANQLGAKLIVLPDTGHFFHGQLVRLRETLLASLSAAD